MLKIVGAIILAGLGIFLLASGIQIPTVKQFPEGVGPVSFRCALCRVACIARRLFRRRAVRQRAPISSEIIGKRVFCQVGPARWFAYSPPGECEDQT
jgi:hypothetical protein